MTATEQRSKDLRHCFVVRSVASGQIFGAIVACPLRRMAFHCALAVAISAAGKLTGRETKIAQTHHLPKRSETSRWRSSPDVFK